VIQFSLSNICTIYLMKRMQVTVMFQKMVLSDGTLKVADVSVKEECKAHPSGLNTVNMLKVP
jgi:hypothetical protein